MIERAKKLIEKAWTHKGLRHYGANTVWLFAEKAVRMAIGFVVGIYVARQLGPAKYGLLNYALSFVCIFSVIASLGLDQIVIRELVKYPDKRNKILGSTFVMRLAGFLLMLLGIGISLYFSSNDHSTNLIVMIIAAGYLFQIFQTIDFYFQSQVLSKYVAISQIIAWSLVSCGRAYCAWKGYPLIYFAALEAINMCLMSLGYLFFYTLKVSHPFHWQWDFSMAKKLLKSSWPLLLSGGASMIYMRVDQIMIKSMLGNTEVGYYAIAIRLVELWYFLPMIICSSLFPSIIRAKEVSREHYQHRLQMLFTFLIWSAILLSLVVSFCSQFVIRILYGEAYIAAGYVLSIYIWRTVFTFFGVARGRWLIVDNLQKYSLLLAVIGALLNVLLNYILIKSYGINGAAIATLIATALAGIIIPYFIKDIRQNTICFFKAIFFQEGGFKNDKTE
jgi:O-antigen/teichoic acid export membrane protein